MADRKKAIKGLEMCLASIDEAECPEECPYYETCRNYENRVIFQPVMRDTLELLKEQEPVEPILVGVNTWICGECGALLGWEEFTQPGLELVENRFCPHCGRRVKWNA